LTSLQASKDSKIVDRNKTVSESIKLIDELAKVLDDKKSHWIQSFLIRLDKIKSIFSDTGHPIESLEVMSSLENHLRSIQSEMKQEQNDVGIELNRQGRRKFAQQQKFMNEILMKIVPDIKSQLEIENNQLLSVLERKPDPLLKYLMSSNKNIDDEIKCHQPGTRLSFLKQIDDWLHFRSPSTITGQAKEKQNEKETSGLKEELKGEAKETDHVYWLQGGPGVGKTHLSALVSEIYVDSVVAVHFCRHNIDEQSKPKSILLSLASQLAQRFDCLIEWKSELLSDSNRINQLSSSDLFEELFVKSLHGVKKPSFLGDLRAVILIDALDEVELKEQEDLLRILSQGTKKLPEWFGLIVTSRPESRIFDLF